MIPSMMMLKKGLLIKVFGRLLNEMNGYSSWHGYESWLRIELLGFSVMFVKELDCIPVNMNETEIIYGRNIVLAH